MNYKNFSAIILIIFILGGCNKYLEEVPDDRVELNNLTKAAQLLTNGYPSAGYNFTEWMSDNVTFTYGTTLLPEHSEAYEWEEFTGIFQDTPAYYWNSSYEAIAHANEVLAVIDELPGDEEQRNAVKGEALLIRAYNHFMLVNLFANHYNNQRANRDLGVPYVEEPERVFIKQYQRNTVKDVYDKIERDMLEGIGLINNSYYANTGKYHFTKNAALALASRFYLFKGDFENCIKYSSEMLGNSPEVFVKDIPGLLNERVNTEDYVRLLTSPNYESNILLMRKITNFHVNVGHWPDSDIFDYLYRDNPFNATDERGDPAYIRGENGLSATRFEFLFERSSLTSNVGLNYTIILAFRGEEVLLNRAEAYAVTNQLENALEDIQTLARKRYTLSSGNIPDFSIERIRSFYGVPNDDQLVLRIMILEERQKEFIHEGLRWFDIKRFGFPVRHVLADGVSQKTLAGDDLRKVLQIPKAAIDVGGLEPNRR